MNNKDKKSKITEFFLRQQKNLSEKEERLKKIEEQQIKNYKEEIKKLQSKKSVFSKEATGLNDKNEIHDKFKNYDHSLEMDRRGKIMNNNSIIPNIISNGMENMRPVEREGKIIWEIDPNISINDLLNET